MNAMLELESGMVPMGELTAGNVIETLPACSGSKGTLASQLFSVPPFLGGTFVNLLPSLTDGAGEAKRVDTVAPVWCDVCGCETVPVPLSSILTGVEAGNTGWNLHPCHESECGCCYLVGPTCGNCSKVEACCNCFTCTPTSYGSSHPVDGDDVCSHCNCCDSHCECSYCEQCENYDDDCSCAKCASCGCKGGPNATFGDKQCENGCGYCNDHCGCERQRCDCSDCASSRGGYDFDLVRPGWLDRNTVLPNVQPESASDLTKDDRYLVNPLQGMADFYIADYVMAVLPNLSSLTDNEHDRATMETRRMAKMLQDHIVSLCDPVFQDYTFLAIGGEARHHPNVSGNVPSGRGSMWDYWHAMGELNGREELTSDCVDIFRCSYWGSGGSFGGAAWATIAKTLLQRLDGRLDPKTFVDRVFTLQHNGGSLLNKLEWKDSAYVSEMVNVGNAHASAEIDFVTLCNSASKNGKTLLSALFALSLKYVPENDVRLLTASQRYNLQPLHGLFRAIAPGAVAESVDRAYRLRLAENEQVAAQRHAYWSDVCERTGYDLKLSCDCTACVAERQDMTPSGVRKARRTVKAGG